MAKLIQNIHEPLPTKTNSSRNLEFQATCVSDTFRHRMVSASSVENRLILETINCTNSELGHSGRCLVYR